MSYRRSRSTLASRRARTEPEANPAPVSREVRIYDRPQGLTIGDGFRIGIGIAFWMFVYTFVAWMFLLMLSFAGLLGALG